MDIREEAINRVQRILDRFSKKITISIGLPMYFEKINFENTVKNRTLVENLEKLYKLYLVFEQNETFKRNNENEMHQLVSYKGKGLDPESLWLMNLENLTNEFENETLEIINESFDEILPNLRDVVHHVELLKQIVERKMKATPKLERERKAELRNAETLIAITQEEIEKLKISFADETQKHENIVETYRDELNNLSGCIDEIKTKHREEFDRELNRYKSTTSRLRAEAEEDIKNLENQVTAHEAFLIELVRMNIEQEKSLRQQCLESEEKYLIARNQYDRELTKLSEERETLEVQVSITKVHYEILKNEHDVQSALYLNLKKERELALMAAFAEKIDNFEKNRAARIIQSTWRAYHERIQSKKKKRSKKKR